ncbi:hypothetical protein GXW83_18465 [Streptacidiphilus sp. PB12-B1b]|uniref:hypothetical protein n=1 Tax=Streptacidiphilus sp. PB12-B1b TaxID=2705012 RepID=UPI0015FCC136|nr:hypothetical protein [Streptacidiphilus sp. PB12-B1b]QMU77386.1 hypothetical protein GXW83_18465 [Streptacidiphilus sp. PB12-B1b]
MTGRRRVRRAGRSRTRAAAVAVGAVLACLAALGAAALLRPGPTTPATGVTAQAGPAPASAARLVVSMSAELSLIEQVAGGRDTDARAVLWQLLERLDLGAAPTRP